MFGHLKRYADMGLRRKVVYLVGLICGDHMIGPRDIAYVAYLKFE